MMKKLLLLFILMPFLGLSQIQIGNDIDGEAEGDKSGWSVSLNADGNILAIGAPDNDGVTNLSGHVRIYENISGIWTQIGDDIDGESAGDKSGTSVSLSADGNILAIGAPNNNGNGTESGHVRVYENLLGVWTQIGDDLDGEAANNYFGTSVSLSSNGNVLAIGAFINDGNGENSGHVRIYENLLGVWTQIGDDIEGEAEGDQSGRNLSLSSDGNIVAIGAHRNDGNGNSAGHVRIYENILGVWTQIGDDLDGEAVNDSSGLALSLSSDGNVLAVGAYNNDGNGENSGHVRIYENVSNVWTQIGDSINGEFAGDFSGSSVNLNYNGDIVVIGAPRNSENGDSSGQIRVYKNILGIWTQIGQDINGEATGDYSGGTPTSLSISDDGSILAIGAYDNDENGNFSGHVRVFSIASELALLEVVDDILGNANGDNISARQLNNIEGVSGAIDGVNYTTALQNGTYTDPNNPTAAEIQAVIDAVNSTLSLEDNTLSVIKLYPNPAKEQITIQLNDTSILEQVIIYNTLGQEVLTSKDINVDTSTLASGSYIVDIVTSKGKATKKLIIN